MKYIIKKTDHGVLVKNASAVSKHALSDGFSLVEELPDGNLYRVRYEFDSNGEDAEVREYFTAYQCTAECQEIYSSAFTKLMANKKIHSAGIGYSELAKITLKASEELHETAEDLERKVLHVIMGV